VKEFKREEVCYTDACPVFPFIRPKASRTSEQFTRPMPMLPIGIKLRRMNASNTVHSDEGTLFHARPV